MTKKRIIGWTVFILICVWIWVYLWWSKGNTSKPENDLWKLYWYQAECQTKIIELEKRRDKINHEIDYLVSEHNWTFEVIQEYKRQLLWH